MSNCVSSKLGSVFNFSCWIATIALSTYWMYIFLGDENLVKVEYKKYFDDKKDVYPELSFCLKDAISEKKLSQTSSQLNVSTYLDFLKGRYFHPSMLNIKYEDIIKNMSDYIESYLIEWRNGSESVYEYATKPIKIFDPSFAGFWFLPGSPTFYNCYALQTPHDYDMTLFAILIRNSIFPSSIKSENYDMLTFLHYPNQLLVSYKTIKYWFASRDLNSSYSMRFQIRGIEVVHRRNKNGRPCNEEWNDYDHNIIQQHLDNVGCRPPYVENDVSELPLCSNKEEMAGAMLLLKSDDYGSRPPCRSMERIHYTFNEETMESTVWMNPGTFWTCSHHTTYS